MYAKGNPVLSKMYAHHGGLTLNDKGLFFYAKENPNFYFLITEDTIKIVEIMGFDYKEYDEAKGYTDFFNILHKNQFFRPSRFIIDPTEGKSKMLKELSEYLIANPMYKGYTTRQIEDMFEPLKEFNFQNRYYRLYQLMQNNVAINKKLNGGLILKLRPDFDKSKLQEGFEIFNNKFNSILERAEFIYSSTEEELVENFVNQFNN